MKKLKKGLYAHYKGKLYEVLGEARHSETLELMVVYKALYRTRFGKNSLWIRPKKMFLEKILIEGKRSPRFKFVGKRKGE